MSKLNSYVLYDATEGTTDGIIKTAMSKEELQDFIYEAKSIWNEEIEDEELGENDELTYIIMVLAQRKGLDIEIEYTYEMEYVNW